MSTKISFRPVSDAHSIKEAVISLFLGSSIKDPKSYGSLQSTELKELFNTFEVINQITFKGQVKGKAIDKIDSIAHSQDLKTIGFRFVNYDENKNIKLLLQGSNEENRTLISFHNLSYTSWTDFYGAFMKYIQVVLKYQDLDITGFSLHYIDEFEIVTEDPDERISFEELFNSNSKFLPKAFFQSFPLRYLHHSITAEAFMERLEIRIINRSNPFVAISHNASKKIDGKESGMSIVNSSMFNEILTKMHSNNKAALKEILTEEFSNKIKL